MTNLVSVVRANVPASCCVDRCQGQGCSVSLEDAPTPFVLINMDCPDIQIEDASKRCDYLFIGESDTGGPGWVAVLELKKGKPNVSEIVPQLQAGARYAEKIIPHGAAVQFCPVAFCGGKLGGIERRRFRNALIRFRDPKTRKVERVRVILRKCGTPLKDVLHKP